MRHVQFVQSHMDYELGKQQLEVEHVDPKRKLSNIADESQLLKTTAQAVVPRLKRYFPVSK